MKKTCEKTLNRDTSIRQNNSRVEAYYARSGLNLQVKKVVYFTTGKAPVFKLFIVALFTLFVSSPSYSQADMDYAIHANIVYRFTKYIDWPDTKKNGDFIIGIVGDSPLYDELKNFIANKRVGNQKIRLKKFSSSESIFNCHILFISEEKSGSMKKIMATTKGTSTLIVSESDGLARKGACINFIVVDDHIKLEINKNNIQERDLSIATELLSLGIIVK